MVTLKDVELDMTDNVEFLFPHATKRSVKGFSFTIPAWLEPSFETNRAQIANEDPIERFLKSFKKGRVQQMGKNKIGKLAKDTAIWFHNKEYVEFKRFTIDSFGRSVATALAEGGISVVAICHAGR